MLLQLGFLQDQQRHILAEELAQGPHAACPCRHVVNLVALCQKHGLHPTGVGRVVQLGKRGYLWSFPVYILTSTPHRRLCHISFVAN